MKNFIPLLMLLLISVKYNYAQEQKADYANKNVVVPMAQAPFHNIEQCNCDSIETARKMGKRLETIHVREESNTRWCRMMCREQRLNPGHHENDMIRSQFMKQ